MLVREFSENEEGPNNVNVVHFFIVVDRLNMEHRLYMGHRIGYRWVMGCVADFHCQYLWRANTYELVSHNRVRCSANERPDSLYYTSHIILVK